MTAYHSTPVSSFNNRKITESLDALGDMLDEMSKIQKGWSREISSIDLHRWSSALCVIRNLVSEGHHATMDRMAEQALLELAAVELESWAPGGDQLDVFMGPLLPPEKAACRGLIRGASEAIRNLSFSSTSSDKSSAQDSGATGAIHTLKTDPEVFQAVWEGRKTFEIRRDDRNYKVGDVLNLHETLHTGEAMRAGAPLVFTKRIVTKRVSHVLSGYGLDKDWVCLSFARSPVQRADVKSAPSAAEDESTSEAPKPAASVQEISKG